MTTTTGSGSGTGAGQGPFEITVGGGHSSLVELTTGELLLTGAHLQLCRSADGGRTWSDFAPAVDEQGAALHGGPGSTGLLRLQSGALAITYGRLETTAGPHDDFGLFIRLSRDEGQTWSPEVRINLPGVYAPSYHNAMIQLRGGRLVLPVRWILAGSHADRGARSHAWGRLAGQRFPVEGHAHRPEMDITFVYYSDDEGQTWQRSRDELMGWFNDGYDGVTPVDEPVAAELRDGRLLLFGRSTVGRIVQSSSRDGGANWSTVEPTDLPSSYSPCRLARVPGTDDLLLIWNQVSGEEIRRGYRRGRLSTAISKDDGLTWEHHRTLALSPGLVDVAQVRPDPVLRMVRAADSLGDMADGYTLYHYPDVAFAGDTTYLLYNAGHYSPTADGVVQRQERRLRVVPTSWLYGA